MRVAIMQPYFLPYIGYFQLIAAVDKFVVYDNVKYTKKGWINRNRMLVNGQDALFTVPLKSASDALNIGERELHDGFDRTRLLAQFRSAYRRAPFFNETMAVVERVVMHDDKNLFGFLKNSIANIASHLDIQTQLCVSSDIPIDHSLTSQDKVVAICQALGAITYVNAIGGKALYSGEAFAKQGIDLKFIRSNPFVYPQFGDEFQPWLSIVDVMMFNSPADVSKALRQGWTTQD